MRCFRRMSQSKGDSETGGGSQGRVDGMFRSELLNAAAAQHGFARTAWRCGAAATGSSRSLGRLVAAAKAKESLENRRPPTRAAAREQGGGGGERRLGRGQGARRGGETRRLVVGLAKKGEFRAPAGWDAHGAARARRFVSRALAPLGAHDRLVHLAARRGDDGGDRPGGAGLKMERHHPG